MHLPHADERCRDETLVGVKVGSVGAGARYTIEAGHDEFLAVLQWDEALNPPARLMQKSNVRVERDRDVLASRGREYGRAPTPGAICIFSQRH